MTERLKVESTERAGQGREVPEDRPTSQVALRPEFNDAKGKRRFLVIIISGARLINR